MFFVQISTKTFEKDVRKDEIYAIDDNSYSESLSRCSHFWKKGDFFKHKLNGNRKEKRKRKIHLKQMIMDYGQWTWDESVWKHQTQKLTFDEEEF